MNVGGTWASEVAAGRSSGLIDSAWIAGVDSSEEVGCKSGNKEKSGSAKGDAVNSTCSRMSAETWS